MSLVDWRMKGPSFANCNCDWGCPCQFSALPTHGDCRGLLSMRIDEGHFGDVRLDGLLWAATAAWPAAIHEGNGTWQSIIDERADDRQREALVAITHGRETAEGATMLWVYNAMCTKTLDTLYERIDFEVDIEKRTARVEIPGLVKSVGTPIIHTVSGEEHRARVTLPDGFEYTEAEYGSGTTRATGEVPLDFNDSHGQFAMLHLTTHGVVR